jgi:hypothetical protein
MNKEIWEMPTNDAVRHSRKTAGFSIAEVSLATLIVVLSGFVIPNVSRIADYVSTRATAAEFAEHLKEAQKWAVSMDVDRRVRLATESGYVVEKRAGAGWLLETSYRLPEGFEVSGPETTEFYARGNVGPTAGFVITGPEGSRGVVITEKKGKIFVE